MRKVFISFLGTGNYEACTYQYRGVSKKSNYVQSALLQLIYKDFTEDDRIKIFITESARKKHWDKKDGLYDELCSLGLKDIIEAVLVPEGKTEEELWEIFRIMYDQLEPEDSIVFDATHGFRSLPIFGMTVLNYSQYLKNTSVEGIFYGAFEAKNDDNVAPVFNLSAAFDLIQWGTAAELFTNYGVANKFTDLAKKQTTDHSNIKNLSESILKMINNMKYIRGKQITNGEIFNRCIEQIEKYKMEEDTKKNPVLVPILDTVIEKIRGFQPSTDALNFLPAIQWYIDHDMPAEALSMLKEGITTYLMEKDGYDYKDKDFRSVLSQRLAYADTKNFRYEEKSKKYKNDIEKIMSTDLVCKLKPIIERFNSLRNDIDHCGFGENARNPENIKKEIKRSFKEISEIFVSTGEIEYQ